MLSPSNFSSVLDLDCLKTITLQLISGTDVRIRSFKLPGVDILWFGVLIVVSLSLSFSYAHQESAKLQSFKITKLST